MEDNPLIALTRRALPFTSDYRGGKLATHEGERLVLTPMVLVLVAIGSTDLLFAFDSIPAVFGVTQHTYIVLCANAFALLGLRALFFWWPECSTGSSTSQAVWQRSSPSLE